VPAEGGDAISAEEWSSLGADGEELEGAESVEDENVVLAEGLEPEVEDAEDAAVHVESDVEAEASEADPDAGDGVAQPEEGDE